MGGQILDRAGLAMGCAAAGRQPSSMIMRLKLEVGFVWSIIGPLPMNFRQVLSPSECENVSADSGFKWPKFTKTALSVATEAIEIRSRKYEGIVLSLLK